MPLLSPEAITQWLPFLDPQRFAALCNDLIRAAAATGGIHQSCLSLNLNVSEPDGGLDARCVGASGQVGRIIPAPTCGHQFKSGRTVKTAREVAEQDILAKPRVLDLLAAGHPFVYLAATDHGDGIEKKVADHVRKAGTNVSDSQIIVIAGHSLAQQLCAYPSRVARYFGLEVPVEAFEDWAGRQSMSNPYQADADVARRLDALARHISQPGSRTRVVGAPGDGKTRTVLESLRGTGLVGEVLYAEQAELVTASVLHYLKTTPDVQCTLVIDEVDDATAADTLDRFSVMPTGVRLVMIGLDASGRPQPDTIQVDGLSKEVLVATIESIVPGLPRQTYEEIAEVCEHSPKLAVLIAGRVKLEPGLVNHHARLADGQIQGALDNYLKIDHGDLRVLSAVALLDRLGWTNGAEEESRRLFEAVRLDPAASRWIVDRLHRVYGIAPVAGRFRYVSPRILADHLAARLIASWATNDIKRFIDALTKPMVESFSRRLRGLSSSLPNRASVEEVILGYQGPFRRLSDLEHSDLSILLRRLAGPFKPAALQALSRIIDGATDEELRLAVSSRRDLVWALEELLWPEDTFPTAARLLLRLAVNENESIGNNATELFVETFQVSLGRTAAGPVQRLRVLSEVIGSANPEARKLAARALGQAITISNLHRMGAPPTDIPGMPTETWRPATYGELWAAVRLSVAALEPLLSDPDASVRKEACAALAKGLEAAIKFPTVLEAWVQAGTRLMGDTFDVRKQLLTTLEWRLEREAMEALQEQPPTDVPQNAIDETRQAIAERVATIRDLFLRLKGTDFSSRFRWVLAADPWKPSLRPGMPEQLERERSIDQLVAEVLADPGLMEDEWDWLLSISSSNPETWIERLAALDLERVMWPRLLELSKLHERAIGWVSLYHLARQSLDGNPELLDGSIEEVAEAGAGPLQLFDLLVRGGYSPPRLKRLVGMFRDGSIQGHLIRRLAFSSWREALPPLEARTLVESVLASENGQDAAISFLSFYLHFAPDGAEPLRRTALDVLRLTAGHKGAGAGALDEWAEVAKAAMTADPGKTTEVVLHRLETMEGFYTEELVAVLRDAWRSGDRPRLFEDHFATRIERQDPSGWKLRMHLEGFPFHEVGDDYLIAWVARSPKTRAYVLAQVIGSPKGRPSELHARLLEQFQECHVGDAFLSDLLSGSWWGPASNRTRDLMREAREWLEDERPVIREWAQGVIHTLEEMLKSDEMRDAEERFR
jgi:hypothetical protein